MISELCDPSLGPPGALCLLCGAGLVLDQVHRVQGPQPRRDPALVHVAQLGPERVASLEIGDKEVLQLLEVFPIVSPAC